MRSLHDWLLGPCTAAWLFAIAMALSGIASMPQPSLAQGVYSGTEGAPMPFIEGVVAKIASKGPPIKLEETATKVRLVKAYYTGTVLPGAHTFVQRTVAFS